MKKITLTILSITAISFATLAQPVITSANVPSTFTANFLVGTTTGFSAGTAGANQTWNFASLVTTNVGTLTVIPVAGSTFASTYPTANYCYKATVGATDYFSYHILNSTSFEMLSLSYNASNGTNYTPNAKTIVNFPANYNSVFYDSFQSTTASSATPDTVTYDGYGTLILPFGTFTNVVRQKIVANGITDYKWSNSNPYYPLLQTNFSNSSLSTLQNTISTGIAETINDITFSVFPNPTNGQFTVVLPTKDNAEIIVTDILGQQILKTQATQQATNLQLDNNGVYIINVITKQGAATKKLIVNH